MAAFRKLKYQLLIINFLVKSKVRSYNYLPNYKLMFYDTIDYYFTDSLCDALQKKGPASKKRTVCPNREIIVRAY